MYKRQVSSVTEGVDDVSNVVVGEDVGAVVIEGVVEASSVVAGEAVDEVVFCSVTS